MVPLRVGAAPALVLALGLVLVSCVDTGAAPRDREAEIRNVKEAIDRVVADVGWRPQDESVTGAGCALMDCVVVSRIYATEEPQPDGCDDLADTLRDAGMQRTTVHDMGDGSCEAVGARDEILVHLFDSPEEDREVRVAAGYPNA